MHKITTEKTHTSPTGEPRYRVVIKRGSFIQGFACLTASEADEITQRLAKNAEASREVK